MTIIAWAACGGDAAAKRRHKLYRNGLHPARTRSANRRPVRAKVAQVKSEVKTLDDFPSEPGWPVVGKAAWVINTVEDVDPVQPFFERHGSDFVNINRGPLGGWVTATRDRKTVDAILHSEDYLPAWPPSLLRVFSGSGEARSFEANKQWRRAMGKVLRPETVMRLHVPLLITAFDSRIRDAIARGGTVMWAGLTRRLAFEVAARASVGDLISERDVDALYDDFDTFLAGSFALDYGQHDGLPNTLYRRTVDARKRIAAELASRVTVAVAQYKAGALSSPVAAAMFDAYEELGADLEDPEVTHTIVNTVIELMFAGTGTTAHSLGSVAQTLAAHPDWFARAQREQDRLQAAHGPELTGKVLAQSHVAQAITHEIFRLKTPVTALLRYAVRDTALPSGVHVPAGTKVMLCLKRIYGETTARGGSAAFDPTQWLEYPEGGTPDTAAAAAYRPSQGVEASLVFGAGPRKCLGNNLALMEMIAAIAVLARGAGGVRMSGEERDRVIFAMFAHPTGMPLELVPRGAGVA